MTVPRPPPDLSRRQPVFAVLPAGSIVHRFHSAAYEAIFFDRSRDSRFNSPDGSYGVLYTAEARTGAFAETFLRDPGQTVLPADLLARKAYTGLTVTRALRLIRLTGPGLARLGATAEVAHGGLPYDIPQIWSAALHAHPAAPDGIAYTARHDDESLCYALFDREPPLVAAFGRETNLDQDWFWTIAETYGVRLAPPP